MLYVKYFNGTGQVIECDVDFVITHNNSPVIMSLVGNHSIIRQITKSMENNIGDISLYSYSDRFFSKFFYTAQNKFTCKVESHDKDNSHAIIYNDNIDSYVIDWEDNGLVNTLADYLQDKKYLPVNHENIQKVIDVAGGSRLVSECEVYSLHDKRIKAWRFNNLDLFNDILQKINIPYSDTNWEEINTIQDYLYHFTDQVKDKIEEKVDIMYGIDKVPKNINDNIALIDGQIPLVVGGVEVLKKKREKFVYLSSGMGTGKTIMSLKMNDLYHQSINNSFYSTLIIAPNTTLKQWKKTIYETQDIADVFLIKNTNEFIKLYNETGLKFSKPTYIIIGKETLKLGYQQEHGIIPKRKKVTYELENDYGLMQTITEERDVCLCPDCYQPVTNPNRATTIFFKEKDFNKPNKSNYKCSNCDSVLFQSVYGRSKKTSVIDFVKRKNIKFNSLILDEAHEGNNFDSIIGMATRDIMRRSKKVILLSGTVTNGYASSIYNILFSLVPNKLKLDGAFEKHDFISKYGTLEHTMRDKDFNKVNSKRGRITKSGYKEVEGINPMVFTKYMSGNFIFAELEDMREDLPQLHEIVEEVEQDESVAEVEKKISDSIKKVNPFNASFYDDSIVKHYANNPFNWDNIVIKDNENNEVQIKADNQKIGLLNKEIKLIEICKKEKSKNRKLWVFTDFVTGGRYIKGEPMQDRLARILTENGLSVFVLKASVKAIDRDKIIKKNKDKYDVFMSHPKLIEVGVNLQWCTNYVFYTPSYHVNTVRQASRRGLRINSTEDNNIYHLSYNQGVEKKIWERYKLKRAESDSIESKFNDIKVNRTASNLSSEIERHFSMS